MVCGVCSGVLVFARFFFLPSLIAFVSIRVSFLFPSRTSKHVTAPPQVHLLGRPSLIVEFSQTEDCAFKCSMRLCVRMSMCMRVLHCFFLFCSTRETAACSRTRATLKPTPPSSRPHLFRAASNAGLTCTALFVRWELSDRLSLRCTQLVGGWRKNVLEWAYCKQTFVHCSRI